MGAAKNMGLMVIYSIPIYPRCQLSNGCATSGYVTWLLSWNLHGQVSSGICSVCDFVVVFTIIVRVNVSYKVSI